MLFQKIARLFVCTMLIVSPIVLSSGCGGDGGGEGTADSGPELPPEDDPSLDPANDTTMTDDAGGASVPVTE